MPRRKDTDLVEDIRQAIGRIRRYTRRLSYEEFLRDTMVQDAVVRNLEIIGEAAKGFSAGFRKKHKTIRWRDIAGMRDRLTMKPGHEFETELLGSLVVFHDGGGLALGQFGGG